MLGVVCGLESEAVLARKIRGARVVVTAARAGRAARAVRELAASGATQFLSFGIACGIEPDIRSGVLYVGSAVFSEDGYWFADPEIMTHLCDLLPRARCGTVWGSSKLIFSEARKQMLWTQTRCSLGDMESHEVARTAAELGLPFGVLRAVADTSDQGLPSAACVPLRDDGRVQLRSVFRDIAAMPKQIPDLIRLGFQTGRALRILKKAVCALGDRSSCLKEP